VELLREASERFGLRVAAYVLMGDHYHLIVQTPHANLSAAMQWLNVAYSTWFNRKGRRTGHLFQGRFKAVLVEEDGAWLWDLALYVHLNPVRVAAQGLGKRQRAAERAGLLPAPSRADVDRRLACLRTHRWSSYPAYAGHARPPKWLYMTELLRRAPGRESGQRARYRARVEEAVQQGVEQSPWSKLRAQVALGSEAFWRGLRAQGDRLEMTGLRRMERRAEWPEVVHAVEKLKGQRWDSFRNRHGDWGRDLALAAARHRCAMTLTELGRAAGGLTYAAAGQAIRTFERARQRNPEIQRAWVTVLRGLDT
jgi:REP element-mobilizing transposase RayT